MAAKGSAYARASFGLNGFGGFSGFGKTPLIEVSLDSFYRPRSCFVVLVVNTALPSSFGYRWRSEFDCFPNPIMPDCKPYVDRVPVLLGHAYEVRTDDDMASGVPGSPLAELPEVVSIVEFGDDSDGLFQNGHGRIQTRKPSLARTALGETELLRNGRAVRKLSNQG